MSFKRLVRFKNFSSVALALLFLGRSFADTPVPASEPQGQIQEWLRRAQAAQQNSDYETAITLYRQSVSRMPKVPELRANLGLTYYLAKRYPQAQAEFEAALRQNSHLLVPNLFLGLIFLQRRQPEKALCYLQRAYDLKRTDEHVLLGLAQAYAAVRRFDQANHYYYDLATANAGSFDAWYGLGVTALSLESSAMERMAREHRQSSFSRALLAESYVEQGRLRDAVKEYAAALAHDPKPSCIRANLGLLYLQQSDREAAEREWAEEVDGFCESKRVGSFRLALKDRNPLRATEQLESLLLDQPRSTLLDLGSILSGLEAGERSMLKQHIGSQTVSNPAWAQATLLRALRRDNATLAENLATAIRTHQKSDTLSVEDRTPRLPCDQTSGVADTQTVLMRAQCAFVAGDDAGVLTLTYRTSNQTSDEAPLLYWRAKAAKRLAFSALFYAASLRPDSPEVHLLLGNAYSGRKDYKPAQSEYQKILDFDSNNLPAHLGLATVYTQQCVNDHQTPSCDQASSEIAAILSAKPDDPEANFLKVQLLADQQQYASALTYVPAALHSTSGNLPHVRALVAKIYEGQGRLRDAVEELKLAVAADRDGTYYYRLFRIYKKLGSNAEAAAMLRRFQELKRLSDSNPADEGPKPSAP